MNYKSLLYEISSGQQQVGPTTETIIVPSNKKLYNIDLNTREVEAPEMLSVQSEHYAETVYFLVDRYYDNMDLAQTNCVIQYVINDKSYVYAVPFCDVTTYNGKIIIPWSISISATQESGTIRFLVRFYLIDDKSVLDANGDYDPSGAEFAYSLSTLTATSRVVRTLPQKDFVSEDTDFQIPERYFEFVNYINTLIDQSTVYWVDANELTNA